MYSRSVLLTFLGLLVTVNALNPTEALRDKLASIKARSLKRQTSSGDDIPLSSFPTQCQSICRPAISAINTCTTASCICTTAVADSLEGCINCTVNVLPDPDVISSGQQVLDTYGTTCPGIHSLSLTVSGATTRTTSFAAGTGTVTVTRSTPALTPTTTFRGPTNTFPQTTTAVGGSNGGNPLGDPLGGGVQNAASPVHSNIGFGALGLLTSLYLVLA
ncbi:hypothetical protein AMATHDRAFT_1256 [Amanita thiersii Skay4041]|uniref:Extracellular membrane protein CFEM domain-containing protein n=1 Tax=Amanita thiersii Skay4041 TaxID=703135 RepID=A0A2A9NW40_9AGAR|nr:hypothetical protein AMATHDRAFT_1256 [Amanita thiersii Skay4041]